ncbi:MAG: hypothetical protein H0W64_01720 [Gammaproteobacteria bacterium]|nr:hypothetical protein [Gammaproteobacteria bacterium]
MLRSNNNNYNPIKAPELPSYDTQAKKLSEAVTKLENDRILFKTQMALSGSSSPIRQELDYKENHATLVRHQQLFSYQYGHWVDFNRKRKANSMDLFFTLLREIKNSFNEYDLEYPANQSIRVRFYLNELLQLENHFLTHSYQVINKHFFFILIGFLQSAFINTLRQPGKSPAEQAFLHLLERSLIEKLYYVPLLVSEKKERNCIDYYSSLSADLNDSKSLNTLLTNLEKQEEEYCLKGAINVAHDRITQLTNHYDVKKDALTFDIITQFYSLQLKLANSIKDEVLLLKKESKFVDYHLYKTILQKSLAVAEAPDNLERRNELLSLTNSVLGHVSPTLGHRVAGHLALFAAIIFAPFHSALSQAFFAKAGVLLNVERKKNLVKLNQLGIFKPKGSQKIAADIEAFREGNEKPELHKTTNRNQRRPGHN